jgi:hypothetical protein
MKKLIIIFFAAIALYGCSKRMTPSTSTTATANEAKSETPVISVAEVKPAAPIAMERKPGIEPTIKKETTEVTVGKETYKAKCGRCHNLKAPEDYTATRWVKIIDWMAPKAKLEPSEKENVLAYVSFYAKAGS